MNNIENCKLGNHTFGEWRYRNYSNDKEGEVWVGGWIPNGTMPMSETIIGTVYYRKCKCCGYVEKTSDKPEEFKDAENSREEYMRYLKWGIEDADLIITPMDDLFEEVRTNGK